jgi:phosphopantothenoylcysteine decarboxylase/phosphopantothenate--cysteine ligase
MRKLKERNNNAKAKTIVLGITGSIAAYKACDIAGKLTAAGYDVRCILTAGGSEFITALSLQAVTGNPVYGPLFDAASVAQWDIKHISLAEAADIVVIAPASADCIARCAQGRASDLLSSVILATVAPVLIAPAMNCHMYEHPLTQRNLKTLSEIGYQFIGPDKGRLACGTNGIGRMAEPADIIKRIEAILRLR